MWGAQATRAAKQFCHRTGVRKTANSVWIGVRKQTRWMGGQTIYHVMCYEQTAARKQIWQLRVFHSRRQNYKFCIRGAGFSAETVPIRKKTRLCVTNSSAEATWAVMSFHARRQHYKIYIRGAGIRAETVPNLDTGPMDLRTYGPMDLWTYDLVDLWTCVDLWPHGPLDLWTCGPVDLWPHGALDLWTCGPMDLWTYGPMDLWTYFIFLHK